MAIMNQLDALSAKEGTVFFTINDKQYELAELISLEAKVEYTKADVTPLNSRMKGGKIVGAEGTGSLKMYYHRPELKAMALNYVNKVFCLVLISSVPTKTVHLVQVATQLS